MMVRNEGQVSVGDAQKTAPRETHTLGPWIIFTDKGAAVAVFPAGQAGEVCSFEGSGLPGRDANAHLIAAAPDLLQSVRELKELLRFALLNTSLDIARDAMPFIRRADAAVAKALLSHGAPTRHDETPGDTPGPNNKIQDSVGPGADG